MTSNDRGGANRMLAVTGANGFVGRHVCEHFSLAGWRVRALVRERHLGSFSLAGVEAARCDLPDFVDETAIEGVDALVHCAYMSRHTTLEEARAVNEVGSRKLIALARAKGVPRFVFISSTSAHDRATSYYGRSKYLVEQSLDPQRDLVLRAGLVLGRGNGGLFQRMVDTVCRAKIVPLLDGGRQVVQTTFLNDVARAIENALERRLTGTFVVADPVGIPMKELLKLAAARVGSRPLWIPVPSGPVLVFLRFAELMGAKLPISSENVAGLRSMRKQPSEEDMKRLGLTPRSVHELMDAVFS